MAEIRKLTKLGNALALLGLMIGYGLFAYLELTSFGERSNVLLVLGNILCPPALLSYFLFDLNAHSIEGFLGWSIIALLNAGVYAGVGRAIERLLRRLPQPGEN